MFILFPFGPSVNTYCIFSAMVASYAGTQSDPVSFIRDDDNADIQSKPNAIAEKDDEIGRLRQIIAEYESYGKGLFIFFT